MRRYPDFRFPRDHWTAGEAFTVSVAVVVALVLIIAFGSLLAWHTPMRF